MQDILVSLFALVSFPVHLIGVKKPFQFFANCFSVLFAQKTWIGYATEEKNLPPLRKAVMTCNGIPATIRQELQKQSLQMLDYWYARDYDPSQDIKIIWRMNKRLVG